MRTERLALRGKPHGNRRRMPSGGREPAEHGLLRRLLVEVKRLRIILFGETDDVVLRHRHWLALEAHADLQVVEPLDHCALASKLRPSHCCGNQDQNQICIGKRYASIGGIASGIRSATSRAAIATAQASRTSSRFAPVPIRVPESHTSKSRKPRRFN